MRIRSTSPLVMLLAFFAWGCSSAGSPAADGGTEASSEGSGTDESGSESGDSGTESETGGTETGDGDGDEPDPGPKCGDGKIDAELGEECDLGPLNSDNGGCTTECKMAYCGDGLKYIGEEACDDGNEVNDDGCTTLCEAPGCDDGLKSGEESDVDCGGGCLPCGVGLNCNLASDCETWGCFEGVCGYTEGCTEIDAKVPEAPTGRYFIDVDGDGPNEPFEVWCELNHAGGGWTLVMVSSDDAQHTWTWVNRDMMATDSAVVGGVDEINRDFKSRAYNEIAFRDLLFVHQPSGVWRSTTT